MSEEHTLMVPGRIPAPAPSFVFYDGDQRVGNLFWDRGRKAFIFDGGTVESARVFMEYLTQYMTEWVQSQIDEALAEAKK